MQYSSFIFNQKKLLQNFGSLGSNNICAMVKANAYGTGLEAVCKTLFGKAKFFGVATIEEALQIRKFDKFTKILVVGMVENFLLAIENNISITIDNLPQLEEIDRTLKEDFTTSKVKVHIKINSGMNRLGINNKKDLKKIIKKIKGNKKIVFEGIYTHFATVNDDLLFFNKQLKKFLFFLKLIPSNFNPIKHLGGGAVLEKINPSNFDDFMFRVGFDLYKNVVKIESKIIKVFMVNVGDRVGYSNGFIAHKKQTIAIVPLGYADGVNRKLGNFGKVKINGHNCEIIGNVCMDMFFVDVSKIKCKIGDVVQVFWSPFSWAKICETIPYEILTSLNYKRMKYIIKK